MARTRRLSAALIFSVIFVISLTSCEYWNKDWKGYLEYWSETVQVGRVEVSGAAIQKNDSGVDTVSLSSTPTITGYIINPKGYNLNKTVGNDSSSTDSVRISNGVYDLASVTGDNTMIAVRLASASGTIEEHTDFTVNFVPVRTDTNVSSPSSMSVTLQYNTPPSAPIPVVMNYDTGNYEMVQAGKAWETDRDGYVYWAWDDTVDDEKDFNCAKWFQINGRRQLVTDTYKVPDVTVDVRSVFRHDSGYQSVTIAAVDSEGICGPTIASGQTVPPATYIVKYDANGATGGTAPASQIKTQYTPVTLATNGGNLTRIGYRFSGWNTAADGNGTNYAEGATYTADASVTLYALWEAVDIVGFAPKSGAVNSGDVVTLTPPAGGTICYKIGDGAVETGNPGQAVTINLYNEKNSSQGASGVAGVIPEGRSVTITAYAIHDDGTQSEVTSGTYSLNKYTVTYNGNDKTGGTVPAPQAFYSGGSVTIEGGNGFTRTGYTFKEWRGNGDKPYLPNGIYSDNADLSLDAKWTANTYTVTLDDKDGTGGSGSVLVTYDQTPSIKVKVPTKTGYTFDGYYTKTDGTGTRYYDEEGNGVCPWEVAKNTILYAKWKYEEPKKGSDDKYEVSNHGNLLWIGEQLKARKIKTFDLKLTADIVVPSGEWVPIDLPDRQNASFDGQGHSITLTDASSGLFVDYNYSTIENLVLKGTISGNSVGGAVAKYAYCTVIRNVMSLVTITNTGTEAAGGLVGDFGGKDDNGQTTIIENCAVYADVSSNGYAGGLVGELWNGNQYGKILNSVYMGKVTGNEAAGAVVGYNNSNNSSPSTLENIHYCVTNNSGIAVIGDVGSGGTNVNNVVSKTKDEIKSQDTVNILGSSWELKSGEDYPTLKQNP